jgi:hypothetical protein
MLAKMTSKNQLTLPKAIVRQIDRTEYFDISLENGRIVLTPMQMQPADAVRKKLASLGITEQDVEDAVRWSRETKA